MKTKLNTTEQSIANALRSAFSADTVLQLVHNDVPIVVSQAGCMLDGRNIKTLDKSLSICLGDITRAEVFSVTEKPVIRLHIKNRYDDLPTIIRSNIVKL